LRLFAVIQGKRKKGSDAKDLEGVFKFLAVEAVLLTDSKFRMRLYNKASGGLKPTKEIRRNL